MELNQTEGNVPTNGTEEKVSTVTEDSSVQSTSLEPTNTDLKNKLLEESAKTNGASEEKHDAERDASSLSSMKKCEKASDQASLDNHVCHSQPTPENGTQKEVKITCDNDTFVCGECGFSAQGPGFEEHLMCHLLMKPYQCIYCKESFVNRKEIGRHVAVAHKGKKMNCALRAMKKAKAFMAETRKTGSFTFMAKVSGRVPLTSTKSDSVKISDPTSSSVPSATSTSNSLSKANTDSSSPILPNTSDDTSHSTNSKDTFEASEAADCPAKENDGKDEKNGESQNSAEDVLPDDAIPAELNKESKQTTDVLKIAEAKKSNKTDVPENISDAEGSAAVNKKISDAAAVEDLSSANEGMPDTETTNDSSFIIKENEKITENEVTKDLPAAVEENEKSPESESTNNLLCVNEADKTVKESLVTSPVNDSVKTTVKSTNVSLEEDEATNPPTETVKKCEESETADISRSTTEPSPKQDDTLTVLVDQNTANKKQTETDGESKSVQNQSTSEINDPLNGELATKEIIPERESNKPDQLDDVGESESRTVSDEPGSKETITETSDKDSNKPDQLDDVGESESRTVSDETVSKETITEASDKDSNKPDQLVEISESESRTVSDETGSKETITETSDKDSNKPDQLDDVGESESRAVSDESRSKDVHTDASLTIVSSEQDVNEETHQPMEQDPCEKDVDQQTADNDSADMNLKIVASFSLNDCPTTNTPLNSTEPIENSPEEHLNQISEPPKPPPLLSVQEVMSMIKKQIKNENFYACGFQCDFSCLNSSEFREHLQIEHFASTTYPCCHCGWTTHNEESLLKHVTGHAHAYNKTAPLYFCGVLRCRFGTNIIPEYINHMNILHPELLQFNCKECGSVFENTTQLVQHFEDNYLHVVNCPHCCSKAQNRHVILRHISEAHPGKPKMLSVGKQIICKDRKVNSFYQLRGLISNMRRSRSSITNLEHILNLEVPTLFKESDKSNSGSPSQSSEETLNVETDEEEDDNTEDVIVKSEAVDNQPSPASSRNTSEHIRLAENLKCNYCTFVAKDSTRLARHQTCHTGSGDVRQQAKKQRFKCPYCPQCFENLTKFTLHVSCHPGLIKYTLLTCKQCEFNSNQKHNMLRHIETKCGRNFVGCSEDMYSEDERVIESKVLECDNCSYQTRHKIHLKTHYESEHNISYKPGKQQATDKNEEVTELNTEEMSVLRTPPAASSRENLQKKFMCPVCFYLLPKGADLKKHIRKHPELGKVSLVLFRCRYCSCASTAKHVIAGHIKDKHPGRDVALVKKIISVDTREQDNSFSETQVSETPVSIPESEVSMMLEGAGRVPTPSISKIIEDALEVNETYYHVFIVPEYEKGNFHSPVNCPCCEFLSYAASPFIQHLKTEHPKVCIIGKQGKGVQQKYYKLGNTVPFGLLTLLHSAAGLKQEVVVLSHKDVFGISAQCPKCVFSTYFKQNLALHIRDHHRELSILESQKEDITSPKKLSTDSLPPLPPMHSKAEETLAKLQALRKQDPIIVGSGILDDKLKGLYENLGFVSRCAICGTERPKRYHMHVHVLRHLNVSLWKCQYCDYKGLERYKMCKHIKDQHPQKKMAIKYLPVDIEDTITEYLNERSAAAAAGVETSGPKVTPGAKYSMDAAFSPLGNDDLDEHLKELYREDGEIFYCILCSFTVRRKFAIHRHLVTSHLAIALVGCGYCGFRGVDRKSVIDHSHEQHNQSTLNVILLPNDLKKTVADCLRSSGLKGEESTPIAEPTVQFQTALPKAKQKARKSCPTPKPATIRLSQLPPLPDLENSSTEPSETKKYVMGTEALDAKLKVMFTVQGGIFTCNICETNFPRRYAIHRHLLMSHLKIGLMQCPLCPFTGVERYLVMNHLKDYHKLVDQIPVPSEVDMDAKISEFLSQELSQNRNHFVPRKKPNYNKKSDGAGSSKPMVVAMFNKRKSSVTKEDEDSESEDPQSKKIKQEIMDEEIDSSYTNSPSSQDNENDDVKPEAHWEASNENVSVRQPRSMIDVGTAINVINLCQGSVKKFGCERCSFTSVHRSNVQRHVFRVHEKYRYKICKLCGYRTLSNVLIRQHIQDKHTDATDGDIEYEKLVSDKTSEDNSKELSGKQIIQQGLYACAYCEFETNTSDHIVKHMEHEHPKTAIEEPSHAATPVLKIPSFPPTKSDSSKKKALSCKFCSFECNIFRLLKSHVALVHKDEPKAEEMFMVRPSWKYACVECHLKMDAGTKMKCHIGRHFNYKPYVCETCSADFASPDEMRKHIRRYLHSEKINYVKDDAQEERLEALLEESKKYALDIQEGKCPNLNPHRVGQRIAKTKTQIMTKVITPAELPAPKVSQKRKLPPPVKTETSVKQMRVTGGFGCSKCDFTSQSINDVSTHHMRAHRNMIFLWRDLVMGYLCDANGKVVESEGPPPKKKAASFKTTSSIKGTLHTCSKCGFNTGHLQGIVGHVKAHGIRDYLCAYCSNRYFKRAMLNKHQKSVHKGKRLWIIHQTSDDVEASHSTVDGNDTDTIKVEAEPLSDDTTTISTNTNYCCHKCNYKADSLYQYRLHIPTHGDCEHLVPDLAAESPLKCGYCAYIAVDPRDFSAHITIHLSDRTYKCFFCEYSSYQRKDVQFHLLNKHSGEGASDENKFIVSSKDLSQGTTKTNESGLPMLANLDPRVVLNRINMDDIPHGYKRLSLSSVMDVSSAFQILESEMGALTDSEQNEEQERIADSENASEISLSLDNSSLADSETISISDAYVTNISQDVLDQVSITNSPADSGVPSSSKSDAPSEFDNFDSIDKAIEQLSNQSDKTDSSKIRTRARDSRSSKNLFDSFKTTS